MSILPLLFHTMRGSSEPLPLIVTLLLVVRLSASDSVAPVRTKAVVRPSNVSDGPVAARAMLDNKVMLPVQVMAPVPVKLVAPVALPRFTKSRLRPAPAATLTLPEILPPWTLTIPPFTLKVPEVLTLLVWLKCSDVASMFIVPVSVLLLVTSPVTLSVPLLVMLVVPLLMKDDSDAEPWLMSSELVLSTVTAAANNPLFACVSNNLEPLLRLRPPCAGFDIVVFPFVTFNTPPFSEISAWFTLTS